MAHRTGHPLLIYTTLYQATHDDIEKLVEYPYLIFCLHLPDGEVLKFPLTRDYKDNVFTVLQKVKNVQFVTMNELFTSNNRENVTRGNSVNKKFFKFCQKLKYPQFNLLPNGDVYLCGMDFGLSHPIGNLFIEDYETLRQRFFSRRKTFQLCSICSYNKPPLVALAYFIRDKLKLRGAYSSAQG